VIAWTVSGATIVWQTHKIIHPRKMRYPMKKIVIISEQGRVNHGLIALLTALFPECDNSIVSADRQDLKPFTEGTFSKTGMQDETRT